MNNKQYQTDLDNPISEVALDEYYVVIGTETNLPELAYLPKRTFALKSKNHHDLKSEFPENNNSGEWGHAFFYITKNQEVLTFFSFGPAANGNNIIGNLSTCDYPITEVSYLYRAKINEDSARKIMFDVNQIRKKSLSMIFDEEKQEYIENNSSEKKYRALTNSTCAKEAEKILKKNLGDIIPDGKGFVKYGPISIPAVNPYSWWEKLQKSSLNKFKYPQYPELGIAKSMLGKIMKDNEPNYVHRLYGRNLTHYYNSEDIIWREGDDATKEEYWVLGVGDVDPLVDWGYINE